MPAEQPPTGAAERVARRWHAAKGRSFGPGLWPDWEDLALSTRERETAAATEMLSSGTILLGAELAEEYR